MFTKYFIVVLLLASIAGYSAELVFTFANGSVSGSSPKNYSFDVMVSSDQTGTQLGDTQIYINYSTAGFGTLIHQNSKITVNKGSMLTSDYQIVNILDNTESRFVVTLDYTDAGSGVPVTTSPVPLLNITIEILDDSKSAGLTFDDALMTNQQYFFDDAATYSPVTAGNTDDSKFTPIAVDLISFSATATEPGVMLEWQTANEINLAGFNIFRSVIDDKFGKINERLIPASGANQTIEADYSYLDVPTEYATYFYKLQAVDLDGKAIFFPVQKVDFSTNVTKLAAPTTFALEQNYPNPFNPETQIRYLMPTSEFVSIVIYNIHGRRVRQLVNNTQPSGFHSVLWDGLDDDQKQVGSGTFIVVMKTVNFREAKRLTLLR